MENKGWKGLSFDNAKYVEESAHTYQEGKNFRQSLVRTGKGSRIKGTGEESRSLQAIIPKKDASQSMTQYVHSFTRKAEQLEEVGIKIPNELLSVMLLNSLPSEYDNFCVAIESRDEVPDIESLKQKLIEQEARLNKLNSKHDDTNQNDALTAKGKGNCKSTSKEHQAKQKVKFNGNCFKCDKVGHRANDCRTKKTLISGNKTEDAMQAIVLTAEPERSAQWCLDSDATRHMCNE
ncbi:retrovirus-related pol polyprotein from transposon tnt 1-94 [Lasius niger]|uniref:Retrovirus-related pol polyprotein from transposon tnt 1-94 n=1 Tax=Lasius niger TaxID=67767 RepID=A0A0J7K1X1_LASNI|nr:retrovirus-related pol polyprotein from transposon tnt 1-94 [Lasius niger]